MSVFLATHLVVAVLVQVLGQDAIVTTPRPPSSGFALLDCHVSTLDGKHLKAKVTLDYSKNSVFAPFISVESSDPSTVASMPSTYPSVRSGGSNYASNELIDKRWQIVGFEEISSASNSATVRFYNQDVSSSEYGPYLNTLRAVGICSIKFVSQL